MYDKGKYIASSDNAFAGGWWWQGAKAAFAPPPLAARVRHCGERNYFIHITLPAATRHTVVVCVYTHSVGESETGELISVVRAVSDRKRTPSCTSILYILYITCVYIYIYYI